MAETPYMQLWLNVIQDIGAVVADSFPTDRQFRDGHDTTAVRLTEASFAKWIGFSSENLVAWNIS